MKHTKATLLNELKNVLATGNWQVANQITFALFCGRVPKDLTNPGWIHYNLDQIEDDVLREVDCLWVHYSQGRFGFSVQWQIYYQLDLENNLDEEEFAQKVGRHEYVIPYDVNQVNFNLDCPVGHLPWFYWKDYTKPDFHGGGIMGGGGVAWLAIFEIADRLERVGVIPLAKKVWNREEIIEAISKGERIFSRGNLRGIDLQGLDLSGCYFINADLSHSNLSNCKLNQVNFHSSNLYEANLENIEAKNTCWKKANLEGAIFTGSQLSAVDFSGCSSLRAVFDESNWQNVQAKYANFWGVSFYHSRFNNCNFKNTDVSYSNWQEAILENCDFTDLVTHKTQLNMTQFIGHNWSKSQCLQAGLENINITFFDTSTEEGKYLQSIVENTVPKIMIIDDSITVRELLSISFNKVGYEVIQARDGRDAWEKLNTNVVCDFIFCDVEMPRMDGLEFFSRMKKDKKLKHIPIAIITSRGAQRMRPTFWDTLDIVGYFTKPFTKPYLEEVIFDIVAKTLGINNQIQNLPESTPVINLPQTRFFAIGLNVELRKNLVSVVRHYPQLIFSFFLEDEVINPDDANFDYQSLMLKLKRRTRKTIRIPSSIFSISKTCTFIPNHFFDSDDGNSGHPISYPVYLVIDVKSFQSLQKIDFNFNFQETPVILIGDEKEMVGKGWNIQGCVSSCEEIIDIIERR
jgi:uncharacterized protein YjbI with pentapeptide repeats